MSTKETEMEMVELARLEAEVAGLERGLRDEQAWVDLSKRSDVARVDTENGIVVLRRPNLAEWDHAAELAAQAASVAERNAATRDFVRSLVVYGAATDASDDRCAAEVAKMAAGCNGTIEIAGSEPRSIGTVATLAALSAHMANFHAASWKFTQPVDAAVGRAILATEQFSRGLLGKDKT